MVNLKELENNHHYQLEKISMNSGTYTLHYKYSHVSEIIVTVPTLDSHLAEVMVDMQYIAQYTPQFHIGPRDNMSGPRAMIKEHAFA